jgi:hypothetical protein
MISKVAPPFWKRYARLPTAVQQLADKNFELWRRNPGHASLHFKHFRHGDWSARVGAYYRVVGYYEDRQTFVWTWIGTHEEYNKL